MNKDELVTAVAAKTGLSKASARETVDAVLETIMDIVRDGDKVVIPGFGTFLLVEKPARQGRNPRTGEVLTIPVRKQARFIPGSKFRAAAQ